MKGYHTTVVIHAPPEDVWTVLTDFDAYPEWNPLVARLEGVAEVGRRVTIDVVPLGRSYRPRISALEPPRRFAWTTWELLPFLLSATHYFRLEPTSAGTRLHHGERFEGPAARLLGSRLLDRMHQTFIHHDLALKQRVEGMAREPS